MSYKAWFEKYRPITLDDVTLPNETIKKTLEVFYNNEFINGNLLSYGPAGYGKTSINEVLIHKIVKSRDDIFILGRKADDVDNLKRWLQQSVVHSRQKIVKIEEIDRLSSQAQTVLKDGLMEKYQHNCAFLATTNKPEKLDPALLTRFNTKINFMELPREGIINRFMYILEQEKITYKPEDIEQFVDTFIGRGVRDMINNLELASNTGVFDPSTITSFIGTSGDEKLIADYIIYLTKYVESKSKEDILKLIKSPQSDTHFFQYYEYILKLFKSDLRMNYDEIFHQLQDANLNLFYDNIVKEYYQNLDLKRFKGMHVIAMINSLLMTIYQQNGGIVSKIGFLEG